MLMASLLQTVEKMLLPSNFLWSSYTSWLQHDIPWWKVALPNELYRPNTPPRGISLPTHCTNWLNNPTA